MHKVLVINAVDLVSANEFCNSIGAQGETFSVSLFDSDDVLAGYWCGWNMTEEQFVSIEGNTMFQVFDTSNEALLVTGWHVSSGNEGE